MADIRVRSRLPVSAADAFAWHAAPGAFARLAPPWTRVRMVSSEGIEPGDRAVIELRRGPLRIEWHALHHALDGAVGFADTQERGPFRRWYHEHRMEPAGEHASDLVDAISLAPTGISVADRIALPMIAADIRRQFVYRHRVTAGDLAAHRAAAFDTRLRIGITGAGGTIGTALSAFLAGGGHDIVRFVRRKAASPDERTWDPSRRIAPSLFRGLDALVHLSGSPIPARRWSASDLRRMHESRVGVTRRLAEALAAAVEGPRVLVQAGGISIYGRHREGPLDEAAATRPGDGFLAGLAHEWESASGPADEAGIRTVVMRIAPVLSPGNGLLDPLRTMARLPIVPLPGSGTQIVSWIAMDDVVGAILHILANPDLAGTVNVAAPQSLPLRQLVRDLAGPVRPVVSVPESVIRTVLGQAADETVLTSLDVRPARLVESGYRFRHPDVHGALDHVLGRFDPAEHPDVQWTLEP